MRRAPDRRPCHRCRAGSSPGARADRPVPSPASCVRRCRSDPRTGFPVRSPASSPRTRRPEWSASMPQPRKHRPTSGATVIPQNGPACPASGCRSAMRSGNLGSEHRQRRSAGSPAARHPGYDRAPCRSVHRWSDLPAPAPAAPARRHCGGRSVRTVPMSECRATRVARPPFWVRLVPLALTRPGSVCPFGAAHCCQSTSVFCRG